MRFCQYCGRHACHEHLVPHVYGYGDLCIECSKTFKKSYYGIGNIWFKKRKGASEVSIFKTKSIGLRSDKRNKVFEAIKSYLEGKGKILISSKKPSSLSFNEKGKEINVKIVEKNGEIAVKMEWKANYGNMFSEKDFDKFDNDFKRILAKLKIT